MALFQPAFVVARVGQDVSFTTTVPGDTTGWQLTATLRDQLGPFGNVIATKTVGNGIVNNGSGQPNISSTIVITWNAADTAPGGVPITPGPYYWNLTHTNFGSVFDVVDWSTFLLTPTDSSAYPQLTNVSELLVALEKPPGTVPDPDFQSYQQFIAAAERAIRDLCGRNFNYATYTDYPDSEWTQRFQLREYPVNPANAQVFFDRNRGFDVTTQLVLGTDYIFDHLDPTTGWSKSGIVIRLNGMWQGDWYRPVEMLASRPSPAKGMIKVVYAAGYNLIPADIKTAIHEIVADRIQARKRGVPLQSESGQNYSYSRGDWAHEAQKLASVQMVIANYKRGDTYVGG